MKEDKKLNSIATLTQEEMVNTKGGLSMALAYVDVFPYGIPVDKFLSKIETIDKSAVILKDIAVNQAMRF